MILALVSTCGYLASHSLGPLLVFRLLWGIAFSLLAVGGVSIMLDHSTVADRGRTVGLYQALLAFGTLIALVLSGALTDLLGYRGTLMIYAPLTALGLAIAIWVLRDAEVARASAVGDAVARAPGTLAALRHLDPRLLAPAYVCFTTHFAGSGVVMATLGVSLKLLSAESGGGSWLLPVASLTGLLLAARRLASMVMTAIAGHLLDRLGDRRIVAAVGVLWLLLGFLVLVGGRGVSLVIAGVMLVALGEGFAQPALVVWTGDGAPAHLRGVVMGGLSTAGDLGSALGPLVAYALLEAGGLRSAYALCAVLAISALFVLTFVRGAAPAAQRA
jgi:MFS family permease